MYCTHYVTGMLCYPALNSYVLIMLQSQFADKRTIIRVALFSLGVAFLFSWLAFSLWSSLRVFGSGPFGFGFFANVIAYAILACVFVLVMGLRFEDYRPVDQEPAALQSDYPLPPYRFDAFEIPVFSKWASVGAARVLFFFLCIFALVQYISSTTDHTIGSAQELWSRIILGLVYLICFVLASRIICELVLVVFVVKDRYMGKDIASLKQQHPSEDLLSKEVKVTVEVSNSNSGGYQAL